MSLLTPERPAEPGLRGLSFAVGYCVAVAYGCSYNRHPLPRHLCLAGADGRTRRERRRRGLERRAGTARGRDRCPSAPAFSRRPRDCRRLVRLAACAAARATIDASNARRALHQVVVAPREIHRHRARRVGQIRKRRVDLAGSSPDVGAARCCNLAFVNAAPRDSRPLATSVFGRRQPALRRRAEVRPSDRDPKSRGNPRKIGP